MSAVFLAGLRPATPQQQNGQKQQEQHQHQQAHHGPQHLSPHAKGLLVGLQPTDYACNDHRCCAERRLIENCVLEAKRRGVRPHKVAAFVRRRLGGGVCILRFRSDGSPGCTAPCTLCARELIKYDLKVCCRLESGEVFCGKLSDPGAPVAKVTSGQRGWLTYWSCCKGSPGGGPGGGPGGNPNGGGEGRGHPGSGGGGALAGGSRASNAPDAVAPAAAAAGGRRRQHS